jgi:hypothetical protein
MASTQPTTDVEVTGIFLDNTPIYFDEGGMPGFLDWRRWLSTRRGARRLRLRFSTAKATPVQHISVVITREGARRQTR